MATELQIWKIPISSRRKDFELDPTKIEKARQFCFSEGWVGMGWELQSMPDNCTVPKQYEFIIQVLQQNEEKGKGRMPFRPRAAITAHRALAQTMQIDDMVWCRAKNDVYWLGRVVGQWQYRNSGSFSDLDLFQVRKCDWQRIGPGDSVPGVVKNAYAGRGAAISRIRRELETALRDSSRIWNNGIGNSLGNTSDFPEALRLSAIGHDDLEDLITLYLQAKLDWFVVLSTSKRSTPTTECVLRNARGQRAYLQVKAGNARCDASIDMPQEVDCFFIFDLSETHETAKGKIVRICAKELLDFAGTHNNLLPPNLRRLSL